MRVSGAQIYRGKKRKISRYRDKPKSQISRSFRGENAKFRGDFAAKIQNFAVISRRKFKISRLFRGQYCSEMTQLVTI